MITFGGLLLELRGRCSDPYRPHRRLSQERFGQLLGEEMNDRGFSGTAVHYWENGESQIHKDDRIVLIAILKVLYKSGGLKTLIEAESLLAAGNYRALDENEKEQIFPEGVLEALASPITKDVGNEVLPIGPVLGSTFFTFDFQKLLDETREGPPPAWPRLTAAIMRKISDLAKAANPIHMFIWLSIWIIAYVFLGPSLQWPYPNHQIAADSIYIYVVASFILPLLTGLLTDTDKNNVWIARDAVRSVNIRLYIYQGAFVGFHVGYFTIFMLCLIAFYLQIKPVTWVQFMLAGLPLFMSAVGAHVIPDNLWRAYKRLWISDGWVFFIFIPLGFFWAWFFLEYYLWLISRIPGVLIILSALILTAWWSGRRPKSGKV